MQIQYNLLPASKRKSPPSPNDPLGFGMLRTNHMFVMDYSDGEWHDARIVPYGPFSIMPGAMCLHYGQTLFEGIKAFKHEDGEIYVWRSDQNAERLNVSADVLCMANLAPEIQQDALMRLIDVEREWCPSIPASSLYVRPYMFATQDALGVKPSKSYIYCIMLSPSGPYYGGELDAIRLLISKKFHRCVSGGTGEAKAGGNYASSLRAAEFAYAHKCDQVLYLDASNRWVEEVGSMNHFHVLKDGTFIIPKFTDTILRSITTLSVLELAKMGRLKARQEHIMLEEFLEDIKAGEIIEAGGFGTAAVISAVGSYMLDDGSVFTVSDGKIGSHSRALYELYTGMQTGKVPAPEGWLFKVPHF